MARPARFERAAFRLGGERSILLSYGRILRKEENTKKQQSSLYDFSKQNGETSNGRQFPGGFDTEPRSRHLLVILRACLRYHAVGQQVGRVCRLAA